MGLLVKKLYFDLPGFGRVHSMPGASLDIGGMQREWKKSDVGPAGYTEDPVTASVEFKVQMMPGMSLRALGDLAGINITVTTDGGDTYLLRDACVTNPPKLSGGEIDMRFEAAACEEV
jgi:hypothetical protein